jgi:hypothetical protein
MTWNSRNPTRGAGGMTHNDSDDRPPEIFDTDVTLHAVAGGNMVAWHILNGTAYRAGEPTADNPHPGRHT